MRPTNTLTGQLKKTVLLFSAAMIAMWIFFYFCIRGLIADYTRHNIENAAQYSITQMNTSFLQMEDLYLSMVSETTMLDTFAQSDTLDFHNAVAAAEGRLQELASGKSFIGGIIIYRSDGMFYRLRGGISNTGVERLLYLIGRENEDYICAKLDNISYIGYIMRLADNSGGVVMLMAESDVRTLLSGSDQRDMTFVLAAGEQIVASGDQSYMGRTLSDFTDNAEHIMSARVGYTPFRLFVSYRSEDGMINVLFFTAMALMAIMLLIILQIFLRFWQRHFFLPIQTVIDEVESFESGKGRILPPAGQEHFDTLIRGINDMTMRIETKDKALIVSLKKQINAHFVFNVLSIIKALSERGENEKAGELCGGLSLLLRYANEGETFVSGMYEFFILEKYVEIMQIRYPNRFNADIETDDFLDGVELPRMLLQPILENAIIHGLIGGERIGGTVSVRAEAKNGTLCFIVEDNGCGMSEDALDTLRKRIKEAADTEPEIGGLSNVALINIERRIKTYFGKDYGLSVFSKPGEGTRVTVTLPNTR